MDKTKYQNEVLAFTNGVMINSLNDMGVKNHVIHTRVPFNFSRWQKVRRTIASGNFDLIHAHGTRAVSNTFYATWSLNKPLLYTVHGWSFHKDQTMAHQFLRKKMEESLGSFVKGTICVSHADKETGILELGLTNINIVENGVDTVKYDPDVPRKDLRKDFGISKDEIVVGLIGRICHQKDPFSFIRAAKYVLDQHQKVRFIMVGDGELLGKCQKLAEELNIEDNVLFTGFRVDIPEILQMIDLYCLPSLWEGLPIGLLEAMAMRKSVIASDINGIREVIKNDENGILIPPKSFHSLAEKILLLIQNEDLKAKLSFNARKTVEKNFRLQCTVERTQNIYEDILKDQEN